MKNTSTPRCNKCRSWMTESASGIFYCTRTLSCPEMTTLIKRSDTEKWYTKDEIIEDQNLPNDVMLIDSWHSGDEKNIEMWQRGLSTLNIFQDEHGFWAQDDTGAYSVDLDKYGEPYMTCAPLYQDPKELWERQEWGEPAYGQIETVDEVILRRIEQVVIPAWRALGRPRTYCMDETDRYNAEQAEKEKAEAEKHTTRVAKSDRETCEHCGGPVKTAKDGYKFCPKEFGTGDDQCFYGVGHNNPVFRVGEGKRNFTFLVTLEATGEEEARSFLLGCSDTVRTVERAEDPSGKHWVDEVDCEIDGEPGTLVITGSGKRTDHDNDEGKIPDSILDEVLETNKDDDDYIECEICGKPGTPPDFHDFVKGVEPGPTHIKCWNDKRDTTKHALNMVIDSAIRLKHLWQTDETVQYMLDNKSLYPEELPSWNIFIDELIEWRDSCMEATDPK